MRFWHVEGVGRVAMLFSSGFCDSKNLEVMVDVPFLPWCDYPLPCLYRIYGQHNPYIEYPV